jgi:rhamnosyltransferase
LAFSSPAASVIVRTLDCERTLAGCLASLRRQTVRPEIIVVDSGSSDRTLEIARLMADRVLELPPRSFSYGRALNVGAAAAGAPVHFALSSHCLAARADWIERSLAHYRRPEVAATNGQRTRPDGSPLREVLRLTAETPVPDPFWGFSNHASSWRAEVWRQHRFDETLPASEDFEWSDRVVAAGHTIVFDPALTISGEHRTRQGPLALYRRSVREFVGTARCRPVEPPTLCSSLASWWREHPPQTRRHRQLLSPYRMAVICGRYVGGRRVARERRRAPMDLLYVASGTTAGHRRADRLVIEALRELGVMVESVTGDYRLPARMRNWVWRSMLTIDLFEALAIRRATVAALRRLRPRAVVYATTHAAMLAPRRRAPRRVAIRFDTPAALSRQGRIYALEHRLERRRFARSSVLLPTSPQLDPALSRILPADAPVVPLPIPIEHDGAAGAERQPLVVVYAGSPAKKRLELALAAWALALPRAGGRRLVVTGVGAEEGRWHLQRQGVAEPPGVRWLGPLSPEEHRSLTRRAEVFLSTSRYEDYGIVQLEALADGALLVTTPTPGPYVALALARELAPSLVAASDAPADVASALEAAFAIGFAERERYRERALARLQPFSAQELRRRLHDDVLPLLLA